MHNTILILIIALAGITFAQQTEYVKPDSENLRNSPNGEKIGILFQKTPVEIIESNGKWSKVRIEAWIYSQSLTKDSSLTKTMLQEANYSGGTIKLHSYRFVGRDYLILDISIINKSSKLLTLYSGNMIVIDENERTYEDESISAYINGLKTATSFEEVPSGETRRGDFIFARPKGNSAILLYYPHAETLDKGKSVRIAIY